MCSYCQSVSGRRECAFSRRFWIDFWLPREREIPPWGRPKWVQNGLLGPPGGVFKPSFEIEAVLGTLLNAIGGPLPPPWSPENYEHQIENWHRNRSLLRYGFIPHLHSPGEAFGLYFGPEWGRFWTPGAGGEFSRTCAHTLSGARFSRFRELLKGSQMHQKTASPGDPAPRASWNAPGSILARF